MSHFEVRPDELAGAASRDRQLAEEVMGLAGRMQALDWAAAAAGNPAAARALADWTAEWAAGLVALATSIDNLGDRTDGAGVGYVTTDDAAIPGAGPR